MNPSSSPSGTRDDDTWDAIVIGSGCAGLTAALTARHHGLSRILVLEKTDRVGGSTAVSGGAMWLPGHHLSVEAGQEDSLEAVRGYLDATVGDASSPVLREAFLRAAPEALRFMTTHTRLQVAMRVHSPDYFPDVPGARMGCRAVDTLPFDGRELGRAHFAALRRPLQEFLVLGGMMVSITDVRHLLAVTRSFASWRYGMALVLRYAADRLRGYARGTRLLLGNALAARLYASALDRGIPIWRETPALALLRDAASGRVDGVRVRQQGRERVLRARHGVLVATGGFPWNDVLRARYYRQPPYLGHSMVPAGATGDGIALGEGVGAVLGDGHHDAALWAPVSVRRRPDGSRQLYPHLVWDRAKPGLIAIDGQGRRFVDEATSYHEFVRALYRLHEPPGEGVAHLVCDADFIERWGLGLAMPGGRPRRHLIREGYLFEAPSVAALAAQLGVDPATLEQTVARFNQHAEHGEDPDFGKGCNAYDRNLGDAEHRPNPCVGPLRRAPFYAVRVYPADVGTVLGLRTDGHARALDAQGRCIEGLYVAGNDMHSIAGGEYPAPGIALGPALTFGWLAGRHLAGQPFEVAG